MPVLLYRYMYRIGARATFRHHARAEEALQHFSLIATEELTELLKPVVPCPSMLLGASPLGSGLLPGLLPGCALEHPLVFRHLPSAHPPRPALKAPDDVGGPRVCVAQLASQRGEQ